MRLDELFSDEDSLQENSVQAWAKSGNTVVKKYRCMSGARKGRLVASPSDCSKRVDPQKKINMKKLLARVGKRIARKANRTKRLDPTSKKAKARNNAIRRR